jgi:hypothetical protein
MVKLKQIALDAEKQSGGVWVPYLGDSELLIASSASPEFRAYVRETLRPHRKEFRAGKIKEDRMRELMAAGFGRFILRGWRNINEDDDITPIPHTTEKATELLLRTDLRHLYDFVVEKSREYGNYVQASLEDDLGN